MILTDVNVLLYAHREDAPDHKAHRQWLEQVINGPSSYAVSELVLSAFVRIATHPRILDPPTPLQDALAFCNQLRDQPHCVLVTPGPRHWRIFADLCESVGAKGNLIPDAYLAALALESGCEWISTDGDFSRFAGLRFRHPLE